jgi:hypothetical protein
MTLFAASIATLGPQGLAQRLQESRFLARVRDF